MSNTQITSIDEFDTNNMVFAKPTKNESLGTYRINIGIKNKDKTVGDLLLPITWEAFSFGVEENRNKVTGELQGYQISIVLFDQTGPTDEQLAFVEAYELLLERVKEHLVLDDIKREIKKPKLSLPMLEDLSKAMWWASDENGERVAGKSPTLYPKLMTKKYPNETDESKMYDINTVFADENGNDLNPKDLVGVRGRVRGTIRFESVFIGGLIRLQVKAAEIEFRVQSKKPPRLFLRRTPSVPQVPLEVDPSLSDDADIEIEDEVIPEEEEIIIPVEEPKRRYKRSFK